MKNKNLYYILGGVLVIGVVALVAMQLRGSSSLQGYLALPPRSTVGTTKPKTPNPVATNSSPNVVANLLPPTVNINTPSTSGQLQTGDKFTIKAQVAQGGSALDRVEIYVNGIQDVKGTQYPGSVKNYPYSYTVKNINGLADGTYSVKVVAYDKVGHSVQAQTTFVKQTIVVPPHLKVTSPKLGLIDLDANKEIIFNLILDTSGINSIKYYVEDVTNKLKPVLVNTVTSPANPKLFNWILPVFAWANHDGKMNWHISPYAFIKDASSGKYVPNPKFNGTPELLECVPDPEVSCIHKIRIEGTVNGGPAKIVKEITVVVTNENFNYGPDAVKNNYIRVDVQSIKDIK